MRRMLAGLVTAAALAGSLAPGTPAADAATAATAATAAPDRAKWDTEVFARMPGGHPAYVHVARSGRVYAGTYIASGSTAPSRVQEWSADGVQQRSWEVPERFQRLAADHGIQVAAETRSGRLIVLETSTSSVLTLDPATGAWRRVARLPAGAVPNYAAWAPGGLYVTDYADGVIWRVRPDGRVTPWLRDAALDGVLEFGTTGLRYLPRERAFLVTQQTITTAATLPTNGGLYRIPMTEDGDAGAPELVWSSLPTDLPDGFGVSRSGHVFIAMAGLTNRIVELDEEFAEVDSFPQLPVVGENGSGVPFDTPCSATFLGTRVLVANQSAIQGDATHMAILDVEVGQRGLAPWVPRSARFGRA